MASATPSRSGTEDWSCGSSTCPPDWDSRLAPANGVVLAAYPPADDSDFRSNLVLTMDDVGDATLRAWQRSVDVLLPTRLSGYHLLDLELVELGGLPGVRRLATHQTGEGLSLTLEQWMVLTRRTGYTATATCPTTHFSHTGATLRAVARTLRPPGRR